MLKKDFDSTLRIIALNIQRVNQNVNKNFDLFKRIIGKGSTFFKIYKYSASITSKCPWTEPVLFHVQIFTMET